jgi:glycosyltransferase involved in cell wall biosynthesis
MNTQAPTGSIIVPVYNIEEYLDECVTSLLSQTYPNTEIILVDDGSTDSSGSICDNYSSKHQNIVAIHKENAGVCYARRDGVIAAHGSYITFCDSDDFVSEHYVEDLVRTLEETNSDLAINNIQPVYKDTVLSTQIYNPEQTEIIGTAIDLYSEAWLKQNKPPSPINNGYVYAKLFKRVLFDNVNWDEANFRGSDDFAEFLQSAFVAKKISYNPWVGYYFRQRGSSITHADSGLKITSSNKIYRNSEDLIPWAMQYLESHGCSKEQVTVYRQIAQIGFIGRDFYGDIIVPLDQGNDDRDYVTQARKLFFTKYPDAASNKWLKEFDRKMCINIKIYKLSYTVFKIFRNILIALKLIHKSSNIPEQFNVFS